MIIREESELTEKIIEEDLDKSDVLVIIHKDIDEIDDFNGFLFGIEKEHNIKIIYVHKYSSTKEITLGVKYNK